jgi:hypothetical protein
VSVELTIGINAFIEQHTITITGEFLTESVVVVPVGLMTPILQNHALRSPFAFCEELKKEGARLSGHCAT